LSGNYLTIEIEYDTKIGEIKAKIHILEGIPAEKQILYFSGKRLDDDKYA
jgi:hypothetical protein